MQAAAGYAGDITPQTAWDLLNAGRGAVLVDVRSAAEWTFVGIPDLARAGGTPVLAEWQRFPGMVPNTDFVPDVLAQLQARGAGKDAPVLFLCRSGARSRAAAMALTAEGYTACYNIAGGFEGDVGPGQHRGQSNGWKAAGLPWKQS